MQSKAAEAGGAEVLYPSALLLVDWCHSFTPITVSMAAPQQPHDGVPDDEGDASHQTHSPGADDGGLNFGRTIVTQNVQSIKNHTVVISFQGRVFPVGRGEMMEVFHNFNLRPRHIVALGPVGEGRQWHCVLSSVGARDVLLSKDHARLNGGFMRFSSHESVLAKVRVHWLPMHIPEYIVTEALEQYGEVKQSSMEKSIINGMSDVMTLVRSFVVYLRPGVTKEVLPSKSAVEIKTKYIPAW